MKIGYALAVLALLLITANNVAAQTCGPDAYEPDQNLFEAKAIALDETQTRTFHIDGDRDWLTFDELEIGKFYVVKTFDLAPKTDTFLRVFSQIGNLIDANDDIDDVLCSYYDDGVHFVDEQYCASRTMFRAKESGAYQAVIDGLYFDPLLCHTYHVTVKQAYTMYFPTMLLDYQIFPTRSKE